MRFRVSLTLAATGCSWQLAAAQQVTEQRKQETMSAVLAGIHASAPAAGAPRSASPRTFLSDNPTLRRISLQPRSTRTVPAGAADEVRTVARIWNRYGGMLEVLATRLGVKPEAALAVIAAESDGVAFVNGRPVVRFENHHFWNHWGRRNPSVFNRHFRFSTDRRWEGHDFRHSYDEPWRPVHNGQSREWSVLQFAEGLSRPDALRSTSWGLAQILGSNHARVGYPSAAAMSASFSDPNSGTQMQVLGLFDFVLGGRESSPALTAFRNEDWLAFAREYNGKNNAEKYSRRLRMYYEAALRLNRT